MLEILDRRLAIVIAPLLLAGSILASPVRAADPHPPAAASFASDWDAFAEGLKQQGRRVLGQVPERLRSDPQIQQEIGRLLLGAVAARSIDALGMDGDHPAFLPWANVYLSPNQPNDDTVYRKAVITPGGTYRIRGTRGSLRIFKMFQLNAPIEETGDISRGMGVLRSNDFDGVQVDAEGRFDLMMSAQRPGGYGGDWWYLDPKASSLWLRQVAFDWAREQDPQLSIERLDAPVARPRMPAAQLRDRLAQLPLRIGNTAGYMVDRVEKLRSAGYVNRLKVWETDPGGMKLDQLAGFSGQFYYEGAFDVAPDEALILEAKLPEKCGYWSIILTNDVYESIDWYNNQASLNGSQTKVDGDGVVRIVVSQKDPGVPNWLDTAGHQTGAIQGRWTDCSATPLPTVRKVGLKDLRKNLPSDTPLVTAADRERIIRDRRSHAQQRPLW